MHELLNRVIAELRGTWRFRWYGLLVAWFVAIAGCLMVFSMPDQYEVEARVHVDTDSILQPLLKGLTVQPDINTKVRLMTNTLLSRPNLEKIARETDLILKAETPEQEAALLNSLGRSIQLSGGGNDLYSISYVHPSPQTAQNVVQTTLNILMETTLGSTRLDAASAREFLVTQVQEYEDRLSAAEQRLAQFKRDNLGLLPGQGGSDYYSRLSAAEQQLDDLQNQLQIAISQRSTLQQEVNAIESGQGISGRPNPRVTAIDQQIQANLATLNSMLLQYTDQHPDVIAMRARIERLRGERKQALSEPMQTNGGGVDPANLVYQDVRMRLSQASVQIETLRLKIANQQQRIQELTSRVDAITEVEAKLSNLTRDYDVTRRRYQELLSRLNTAELSGQAETSGGQLKFQIIDPPVMPVSPVGPDRALYLMAVLLASLGAGAGFAFFLHQIRPVFMNRRTLSEVTGRPVLGSVSMALSVAQRRWLRSEVTGFALASSVLVAFMFVGLMFADPAAHMLQSWIEVPIL